jgi:hypothetical protein
MKGVGHGARVGEFRNAYMKGRDHFGGLGVEGKIILKWMLNRV